MEYEIGDTVYYKTLNGKEYYGKIIGINNGWYTIEGFNGWQRIVNPTEIIKKKEMYGN